MIYSRSRNAGKIDPLSLGVSYFEYQITDGAVAQWRLGESGGTIMTDTTGNLRNGTYNTVSLANASIIPAELTTSTCAYFNGSSYSSVATGSWMNLSEFSVEAVVEYNNSYDQAVVSRVYNSGSSNWPWSLDLYTTSIGFWGRTPTGGYQEASKTGVSSGIYHLAGTWKDNDFVQLYINGILEASLAITGNIYMPANPISIGRMGNQGNFMHGRIQGVAMYDKVLTNTQISSHFDATGL